MKQDERICQQCGAPLCEEEEFFSHCIDAGDYNNEPEYEECLIKRIYSCPDCDYIEEENFDNKFEPDDEYYPEEE